MKKYKEVVINDCFGGFGLSDEAFELYLTTKKIKFYKDDKKSWSVSYYRVPKEKYDKFSELWRNEDGDYRRINATNWYLSMYDIKRDDPILVSVVRKLKDKANGMCAELKIVKIPINVNYIIDEYDGLESIHEEHRSWI